MAAEINPSTLHAQSMPRLVNTYGGSVQSIYRVYLARVGRRLTGISKQWKCSGEHASHQHVCCKGTGGQHEVCVDQIADRTLENGEESKTDTCAADTKAFIIFSIVQKKREIMERMYPYAIQGINGSDDQPMMNRPPAKKNDPIIIETSRASGTGLLLFAIRRLTQNVWLHIKTMAPKITPINIPRKGREPTTLFQPRTQKNCQTQ